MRSVEGSTFGFAVGKMVGDYFQLGKSIPVGL
jgi:hypothetical protein